MRYGFRPQNEPGRRRRLFVAVRLPGPIRAELARITGELRRQAYSGSYTRPENLHLTLAFIGDTDRAGDVAAIMDRVEGAPLDLRLGGTGSFRRREGDTVWVGLERSEALLALQRGLTHFLRASGFPAEGRPYAPHLTVGRRVTGAAEFDCAVFPGAFHVDAIHLMESERVGGALTYTELYERDLTVPAVIPKLPGEDDGEEAEPE